MNKLNIGCGKDIKEGYVNLDVVDYGGNQIHDLNKFPYPFEENSFDEIFASHMLEYPVNLSNVIVKVIKVFKNM